LGSDNGMEKKTIVSYIFLFQSKILDYSLFC
jgi:hypothetical protein